MKEKKSNKMIYTVVSTITAYVSEEVEANSPEEAASMHDPIPSLCYHCSGLVDFSDPSEINVFNEEGKLLFTEE